MNDELIVKELGEAFTEFKDQYNERLTELERDETVLQKLNDLEQAVYNVGPGSSNTNGISAIEKQEMKAFFHYCKTGEAQLEGKALLATTGTGQYGVPEFMDHALRDSEAKASPLLGAVRRVRANSGDIKAYYANASTVASGWVGESDARSLTDTPTIVQVLPTQGEIYARQSLSNWFVQDAGRTAISWMANLVGAEFAQQMSAAVISGDGSSKPTGILNGTPVDTPDFDSPARADGVIQYIATGAASTFQADYQAGSPGDPAAVFYDTIAALGGQYRSNARWCMNSTTWATIAKMRDADGRSLLTFGLGNDLGSRLLGYPVLVDENMPDIGSDAFPVLFGDFMRAYTLYDITGGGVSRQITDQVTSPGNTILNFHRRVAGNLADSNAVKAIKVAAS